MQHFLSQPKNLKLYLATVAMIGMLVIYIATSSYGPGISGDSVRYLSVGQNLLEGRGFYDYSLAPLLAWPPLYSMTLALLAVFTRDVLVAGWVLNIVLFGLMIYLTGRMIATVVPNQPLYSYLSAFLVLVHPSLVRAHSIIAADPLFMVLCLLFLHQSTLYLRSGRVSNFNWMVVLAMLASLVKYPGLILSLVGCILAVLYHFKLRQYRLGLMKATQFLLISALPLAAWVLVHNYFLHDSLFGERGYAEPVGNIYITVEKLLYWFIPHNIIQRATPYGLLMIMVVVALLVVQPASWRRLLARLLSAEILPISLYAILYGLVLVFLVSYAEHKYFRTDRLHIALIFPVLVFLVSAAETLRLRWQGSHQSFLFGALTLIGFLVWLIYPINNTRKYIARSLVEGETDNNLYNTRALRGSDIVGYLEANRFSTADILYSNHEGAAWLYTRHNALAMPQGDRSDEDDQDAAQVLAQYASWPPQPGYIIWFDMGFKLHILPPKDLTPIAVITPIFEGETGGVYQVAPR